MSKGSAQEGIVVGVDGSEHSNAAVRWAAHEATMRSAPLNLVYIVTTPLGGWGAWGLSESRVPEDFGQRQEEEGRQIVADAKRIAEASVGDGQLQIQARVVFCPLVPTLIDLSKKRR